MCAHISPTDRPRPRPRRLRFVSERFLTSRGKRSSMKFPRRRLSAAGMAAAVAMVYDARSPADAFFLPKCTECRERAAITKEAFDAEAARARLNAELGELELNLEAQLDSLMSDRPNRSTYEIAELLTKLESTGGSQQRYGWGVSSNPFDLPMVGAWDVLYAERPLASRSGVSLVSARQWLYGPGTGGAAAECVFAGPSSGRVLLTRTGNVTKLEGTALQLDFSRASRAYELKYTRSERMRLQSSTGEWADVEKIIPTSSPSVGSPLLESPLKQLCAPSASGLMVTTYLSDVLWIMRDNAAGAATVLRRTDAEAMQPDNGDGPDGFDARRFGPSGRRMWKFDTGVDDSAQNLERARLRMRTSDELSAS